MNKNSWDKACVTVYWIRAFYILTVFLFKGVFRRKNKQTTETKLIKHTEKLLNKQMSLWVVVWVTESIEIPPSCELILQAHSLSVWCKITVNMRTCEITGRATRAHAARRGECSCVPMETVQGKSGPPIGAHAGWERAGREGRVSSQICHQQYYTRGSVSQFPLEASVIMLSHSNMRERQRLNMWLTVNSIEISLLVI